MIWRVFRRHTALPPVDAAWWQAACAVETAPTVDAIFALRAQMRPAGATPDEAEQQCEMLDGLEQIAALAGREPAVLETQHRVIGSDLCHLAVPASYVGLTDEPGKLFVTSRRLIHVGGSVRAWPWHRIGGVDRTDRALEVTILGAPDTVNLLCNTYGDAMTTAHLARRLQR